VRVTTRGPRTLFHELLPHGLWATMLVALRFEVVVVIQKAAGLLHVIAPSGERHVPAASQSSASAVAGQGCRPHFGAGAGRPSKCTLRRRRLKPRSASSSTGSALARIEALHQRQCVPLRKWKVQARGRAIALAAAGFLPALGCVGLRRVVRTGCPIPSPSGATRPRKQVRTSPHRSEHPNSDRTDGAGSNLRESRPCRRP